MVGHLAVFVVLSCNSHWFIMLSTPSLKREAEPWWVSDFVIALWLVTTTVFDLCNFTTYASEYCRLGLPIYFTETGLMSSSLGKLGEIIFKLYSFL